MDKETDTQNKTPTNNSPQEKSVTLKMNSPSISDIIGNEDTTPKTIFQIEQRIKKGCDKPYDDFRYCNQIDLCPSCQSNLALIQEIRGMIEDTWKERKMTTDKIMFMMDFKKELLGGKDEDN